MARVLVLKPEEMCFILAECEELNDFYEQLECDTFDIATRQVGGKYFDIFCDDIGLFRENPVVSAVDKDGKPMLVGHLIFANHDDHGETTSLTDEDLILICSHAAPYSTSDGESRLAVICDY